MQLSPADAAANALARHGLALVLRSLVAVVSLVQQLARDLLVRPCLLTARIEPLHPRPPRPLALSRPSQSFGARAGVSCRSLSGLSPSCQVLALCSTHGSAPVLLPCAPRAFASTASPAVIERPRFAPVSAPWCLLPALTSRPAACAIVRLLTDTNNSSPADSISTTSILYHN